jgi:CMD domain protein
MSNSDVIDFLAGIRPGSPWDILRAERRRTRESTRKSHQALFEPEDESSVTHGERFVLAIFVAGLHRREELRAFYSRKFAASGRSGVELLAGLEAETARALALTPEGPYGLFPKGPLSAEDKPGPIYRVAAERRSLFGPRLVAAIEHAHLLTFHARDSRPDNLQTLLDAGWSRREIVTLSQIVGFLAYQVKILEGLSVLIQIDGASERKSP